MINPEYVYTLIESLAHVPSERTFQVIHLIILYSFKLVLNRYIETFDIEIILRLSRRTWIYLSRQDSSLDQNYSSTVLSIKRHF